MVAPAITVNELMIKRTAMMRKRRREGGAAGGEVNSGIIVWIREEPRSCKEIPGPRAV